MAALPQHARLLIYAAMQQPAPLEDLRDKAAQAAGFLKMLASEQRLLLLCILLEGEASVGALALRSGAAQPNVSQHLAKLRGMGLVATRREGTTVYYRLADPTVEPIVAALYRRFCAS